MTLGEKAPNELAKEIVASLVPSDRSLRRTCFLGGPKTHDPSDTNPLSLPLHFQISHIQEVDNWRQYLKQSWLPVKVTDLQVLWSSAGTIKLSRAQNHPQPRAAGFT